MKAKITKRNYTMNDKQKKFLQLRASGLSFDKIAVELKISKPTLIQWGRLFNDEINDMKFQSLATLKEEYQYTVKAKYEQLLKHLKKIDDAIENFDFTGATLKDLATVRNDIIGQLDKIEKQTSFIKTGLTSMCEFTGKKEAITVKLNEIE
jgi:chemotaxis regulatin CheY-phosphate phosphatase CheZ